MRGRDLVLDGEMESVVDIAARGRDPREDAGVPVLWEYMSLIIWDDDSKSSVTSDLEDVEVLNSVGVDGWELVCVVPLARTQVLEMAYPGNTRKLLAYFKRQRR